MTATEPPQARELRKLRVAASLSLQFHHDTERTPRARLHVRRSEFRKMKVVIERPIQGAIAATSYGFSQRRRFMSLAISPSRSRNARRTRGEYYLSSTAALILVRIPR